MEPPFDSLSSESWDQKDYTWHPHRMQARRISNRTSKNKPRGCKAPLVCQVEGCNNDLSQLKGYHRRYKICTCHLKTEFIMKDGIKQRFCQQCGRFHDICEFDGLKRSCRVRLRRHNERRRKKPNNNTTSCSESAGTGRTNSNLTMDSTFATGGPASLFNEDYPDPSPLASPLFSSSNQHQYFPVVSANLHHPGIAPPPRVDSASTRANDVASDCATETIDSYPLLEVYRNFKQNCDPMDFLQKIESKEEMMPTIPEMMSPQKQYMGAPLTMPLTSSVVFGRPLMDPVAFLKPDKTAIKPVNCKRDVSEMLPWAQNSLSHRSSSSGSNSDNLNIPGVKNPSLLTVDPIRKNEVLDLYNNVIKLTSVSLKLYSCTPCSLPTNLRLSLVRSVWGGWCPESCIREGCVYLNFDIFRPANNNVLCLEDVVNRLIHYTDSTFWKHITMMVQLDSYSMLVSSGVITRRFDIRENPSLYPNVKSIKPVCVLHTGSREFTITGANLSYDEHISIHCRIQGKFLAVASVENKGETETYCFSIADQLPVGAVKIEISKSGLVCRTMVLQFLPLFKTILLCFLDCAELEQQRCCGRDRSFFSRICRLA
eukprot:g1087.t1